jgi:hypothetical protein
MTRLSLSATRSKATSFCRFKAGTHKTDKADAITLLERKDYSLFVFCNDVATLIIVINNEAVGCGIGLAVRREVELLCGEGSERLWAG